MRQVKRPLTTLFSVMHKTSSTKCMWIYCLVSLIDEISKKYKSIYPKLFSNNVTPHSDVKSIQGTNLAITGLVAEPQDGIQHTATLGSMSVDITTKLKLFCRL